MIENELRQQQSRWLLQGVSFKRIRHDRYPVRCWVHQQAYLNPYSKDPMLRNHV